MDLAQLNLIHAAPEIVLLCLLGAVLLIDLFLCDQKRWISYALTLLSVLVVAIIQISLFRQPHDQVEAFSGMFVNDSIAQLSKLFMYAIVIVLLVYSRYYVANRQIFKGEYYTLTLFALLGMNIMVSANHFLLLYVGLELLSLSLYAIIALRRDSISAGEAALKYFILGSLASGILLYGISLIYGGTGGSLSMQEVLFHLYQGADNPILVQLGLIFIVVGIAFKLGTVPFHMWVPDVYQGAPTAVAAFVGTAPKIAAVVFAFRILITGLGIHFADWAVMLQILAVASLVVGNLAAIVQTNIKRMLAYSTVSHMGFVLLAFVGNSIMADSSNNFAGLSAAIYYVIVYAITSLVSFGVLMALSNKDNECENISDLAGLNQKHPWYAFIMLLAMFSMAGIPPLVGFYAKFYIIIALLEQHLTALAVFAVIMSLIGAFYYIRVVKTMYFDTPETEAQPLQFGVLAKILLSINALLLIVLGVFPSTLLDWCVALFQSAVGG